jgi:hypothetical protein
MPLLFWLLAVTGLPLAGWLVLGWLRDKMAGWEMNPYLDAVQNGPNRWLEMEETRLGLDGSDHA